MARQLSEKGYNSYLELYNKKYQSFVDRKLSTDNFERVYSFTEWKTTYLAARNTLQIAISEGKRKAVGNVNQYIVSRQAYTYSMDQAKRIRDYAMEKTGQKLSLAQIRAGEFDWDPIDTYYQEMKAKGMTSTQAKIAVSQYFFGSP